MGVWRVDEICCEEWARMAVEAEKSWDLLAASWRLEPWVRVRELLSQGVNFSAWVNVHRAGVLTAGD